jgi:hypothetical protein
VIARIAGHEGVGAPVDIIQQFGGHEELREKFPAIGSDIDAVVERVNRWLPPAWVRLSTRPQDLASFARPCEFCEVDTILSPGGDGLVLDVRGNDGPEATR